jgi:hypothetical protein
LPPADETATETDTVKATKSKSKSKGKRAKTLEVADEAAAVVAHPEQTNGTEGDRLRDSVLLVSEAGVPGLRLPLLMARFHRLAVRTAMTGKVTVTDDELQMLRMLTAAGTQAAATTATEAEADASAQKNGPDEDTDDASWGCYSSAATNGGLWAVWEQQVLRSAALLPSNSGSSGKSRSSRAKAQQREPSSRYRLFLSGGGDPSGAGMNRDVPNPRHLLGWGRLASALVLRGWGALEGSLASFEHVYGVSIGMGCARLLCAMLRTRLNAVLPAGALAATTASMAAVLQADGGAGGASHFAHDESAALALGGVNGLLQAALPAVMADCDAETIGRELALLRTLLEHRFVLELQLRLLAGGTRAVLPRVGSANMKWKIPPKQLLSLPAMLMQLLEATSSTEAGDKSDDASVGKSGAASLDVPAFPPVALQLGADLPLQHPATTTYSSEQQKASAQSTALLAGLQKVDEVLPMAMTLLVERSRGNAHHSLQRELHALHATLGRPCVTVPADGKRTKKSKKTKQLTAHLAPGTSAMARRCVLQFESAVDRLREHAVAQRARAAWSSLSSAVQQAMQAMELDSTHTDPKVAGVAASLLEKIRLEWPEMVQLRGECSLVRQLLSFATTI